ncbi:breast carcinoma-amplified sequence 3-like isoform X2 [Dendronephthya gigantea]|uniref:breast carcinoma-amplified sequence 3-like isoform X2 n=1 Tax=Dendronephthya gigantea TaxID=151771 RepID=UPI00106BE310|nr:breast carcinoma-amplified sequence 3-like isoform X2 [Dendronephthya gigantea]
MSNEQTRRNTRGLSGVTVRPQPVSDKSYVESVVDFLHEVVPQAVAGNHRTEEYDHIIWVKLEKLDIDIGSRQNECNSLLFVILGYSNGYQIWHVKSNGEAEEVVSIRQGPVKVARILQTPSHSMSNRNYDIESAIFHNKRPLVAVCDAASPCPYSTVKMWSLATGEEVKTIDFKTEVYDIQSNKRVVVVCLQEKIAVLDASTLTKKFGVTNCFPASEPNVNPVSLSSRWLAFADRKLLPIHQSRGGVSSDKQHSYTSAVFNAAKTLSKGLSMVGETVGRWAGSNVSDNQGEQQPLNNTAHKSIVPGIVTIIDIEGHDENEKEDQLRERAMAHFPAHTGQPIASLAFDPSGSLLFSADTFGQNFHIFRILPHPMCPSLGSVHHLYILHRGETMATVCNVSFSNDARWVAVTTQRGTSHVFPITSYGGAVSLRTHNSSRVVNRSSRFHTSAGLEDLKRIACGNPTVLIQPGSPSNSPTGPLTTAKDCLLVGKNGLVNPRMPPLPHPDVLIPYIQVKLGASSRGNTAGNSACNSPTSIGRANGFFSTEPLGGATMFASSRAWIAGNTNPPSTRIDTSRQSAVHPLFVVSNYGNLVEFNIEIQPLKNSPQSEDMPFQALAEGKGRWLFCRHATMPESKGLLSQDEISCKNMSQMNKPKGVSDGSLKEKNVESSRSSENRADDNWLANIEIETHAPPHRRLWMGPQFAFKTFQPPGTSLTSGSPPESGSATIKAHRQDEDTLDLLTEELDLQSLRIQPVRSDPLPTPKSRYVLASSRVPYGENTMIVDNGPESLTDIYASWPEDVGELSPENGKLIESIADAMNDTPQRSSESDNDDVSIFPTNSPQVSPVNSSSSLSPEWS